MSEDERKPSWWPAWKNQAGEPLACTEKLEVLGETFREVEVMLQDALEDALLMGCGEEQVRHTLEQILGSLTNPYKKIE